MNAYFIEGFEKVSYLAITKSDIEDIKGEVVDMINTFSMGDMSKERKLKKAALKNIKDKINKYRTTSKSTTDIADSIVNKSITMSGF